jgi:hypothetical protein
MSGKGFIDTVLVHETWGSMASGNLADMSNQYAAMPSMHIGWSVWCGITIAILARPVWAKTVGLVYPAVTLLVIVATANHFWLDAVGGLICLSFGYALSYIWYGMVPYRLPRRPTTAGRAAHEPEPGRRQVARAGTPETSTPEGHTSWVGRPGGRQAARPARYEAAAHSPKPAGGR